MKRVLDRLADRGCWISHDRVNAFISHAESGIAEIGYHGTQPVSKNSRLFIGEKKAVFSFLLRTKDGIEHPVSFREVDWEPTTVTSDSRYCKVKIVAEGRWVRCVVRPREAGEVRMVFDLSSLNQDIHGSRIWMEPEVDASSIVLSCRDRIVLDEWLRRTGPYAGDFMIPEPMRRRIFDKRVRSGEASVEDLRAEYRDAAIPIYDASVFAKIGGKGVQVERQEDVITFTAPVSTETAEFYVLFGDQRSDLDAPPDFHSVRRNRETVISVGLPGYHAISEFVETVPGLVESAIVRDIGMPRATPAAYYWIWAWDSMVTGIEMLRWGDYEATRRMAEFINTHRDEGGLIPMRWTRSLEPMDTPPRGALEFLFTLFVFRYGVGSGDLDPLIDAYPHLVNHLEEIGRKSDAEGMFACSGFYPDFAAQFGRSDSSVVAMEVAAHYVFARLMEHIARLRSDAATETHATETADRIERHFLDRFWDDEVGFLVDSYDKETGAVNRSYPLFTLLFLQSPFGWPLIGSRLDAIARFCSEELLGSFGTSLLPSWDRNRTNEDATASWYPHWDIYLLKILRRAGRWEDIMRWLGNVERVLDHLGYCPEFLKLDQDFDDPAAWHHHGAVSNLNCVTGWFRAIVEGVFGIEVDSDGLKIIPLALPIDMLTLNGLVYRDTRWNVTVRYDGDHFEALVIDGERWEGVFKVPSRYYDGGVHELEVAYAT